MGRGGPRRQDGLTTLDAEGLPEGYDRTSTFPVHRPLRQEEETGSSRLSGRLSREDLVLCAVTSRVPERLSEWEVSLGAGDTVEEYLPKISIVKVGKLFTMHRSLVAGDFGSVKGEKLGEVLSALTNFFTDRTGLGKGDGVIS